MLISNIKHFNTVDWMVPQIDPVVLVDMVEVVLLESQKNYINNHQTLPQLWFIVSQRLRRWPNNKT